MTKIKITCCCHRSLTIKLGVSSLVTSYSWYRCMWSHLRATSGYVSLIVTHQRQNCNPLCASTSFLSSVMLNLSWRQASPAHVLTLYHEWLCMYVSDGSCHILNRAGTWRHISPIQWALSNNGFSLWGLGFTVTLILCSESTLRNAVVVFIQFVLSLLPAGIALACPQLPWQLPRRQLADGASLTVNIDVFQQLTQVRLGQKVLYAMLASVTTAGNYNLY